MNNIFFKMVVMVCATSSAVFAAQSSGRTLTELDRSMAPIRAIQEFLRQGVCFQDGEIPELWKDMPFFNKAIEARCPRVVSALMANYGENNDQLFEALCPKEPQKYASPLFYAVSASPESFFVMLEWLLCHKEYHSRVFQKKDRSGRTLLHIAAAYANNGVFQRLLFEINKMDGLLVKLLGECDSRGDTVIHRLLNSMNSGTHDDQKALMQSIFYNLGDKALEFINIRNNDGKTPLEELKDSRLYGIKGIVAWLEAATLQLETRASALGGACSGVGSSHS